ncbi:heterokaryon incompatibility protein-domain-containing protein [Bisporella sp. PMI_857]|nr:heterokaryon incompatibility protein-domain-containing protein [Bisporella sp. PMI_857]
MYSPLDHSRREIRLLRLLPGNGDFNSNIHCELFPASLDNNPSYNALSYVWGDSLPLNHIMVNQKTVSVRENLVLALRRLRAHHAMKTPLILWVDALCIDQSNTKERELQVKLMSSIYSGCQEVCIWLGSCGCDKIPGAWGVTDLLDDEQPLACQEGSQEEHHPVLKADGDALVLCARIFVAMAAEKHINEIAPWAVSAEGSYQRTVEGMEQLANSPWFTRAWIVQEAYFAPKATVYFGTAALPRELLWAAQANRKVLTTSCECCRTTPNLDPLLGIMNKFFGNLVRLIVRDPAPPDAPTTWSKERPFLTLIEFITSKDQQNCTDKRDRIYAYLGIVEGLLGNEQRDAAQDEDSIVNDDNSFLVDYSIEPQKLFLRLCKAAVLKDRSLAFLAWNTAKNEFPGLPSWAMDFTQTRSADGVAWQPWSVHWQSSRNLDFNAAIINDKTLVVRGAMEIDKVSTVGHHMRSFKDGIFNTKLWENWRGLVGHPDRPYPAGKTYRHAWWRALCFDSAEAERKRSNRDIAAFELISTILHKLGFNFDWEITPECRKMCDNGDLPMKFEPELKYMFEFGLADMWGILPHLLGDRGLIVTEKGYLGFARDGVEAADGVFLLPTCATPVILRKTEGRLSDGEINGQSLTDQPIYSLVSDAYIYGIMDGEMVENAESSSVQIVFDSSSNNLKHLRLLLLPQQSFSVHDLMHITIANQLELLASRHLKRSKRNMRAVKTPMVSPL